MTKSNLKNILTAVRDMINRSRIAYKDYLGEETVTETKVLVEGTLSEQGTLILKDPSFTRFVAGEEYKVTIDGTTQTLTAISNNGVEGITNVINFENPGENYFAVSVNPEKGQPMCSAGGTYVGKTISISQTKTTTTKKYDIKKVPQELIPDTIARSADVAKVKTKANDAFNKADAAQAAADNAQTTANDAKTTAENAIGADVVKGNYKLRVGEKKYVGYGFAILLNDRVQMNYTDTGIYDESSGSHIHLSGQSVFKSDNTSKKKITITTNADSATSENAIALYRANGQSTSISADGYLLSSDNAVRVGRGPTYKKIIRYVNTPEEEYDAATKGYVDGKISDTEIFLQSSTTGSTKQFKITVDDSGAITATEVS